jgi:NADPH-dependent 2,4-dienoyl-CoA reductase/sulfur reductase-like enzyme
MALAMRSTNIAPQLDRDDRAALLRRVRPEDWSNPRPREIYDLVVVGAGPAGMEAAQYARGLGLSVALVERNQLGGNSLNAGSIPRGFVRRFATPPSLRFRRRPI